MIHQEIENSKLTKQISTLKDKLGKVTRLMTKINDAETKSMESKINRIMSQQKTLQEEEKVNSKVAKLQVMILETKILIENILDLNPVDLLEQYVDELRGKIPFATLTLVADKKEWFSFNKKEHLITDDLV